MKIILRSAAPQQIEWGVIGSPAGKLVVGVNDRGEVCRISFLRDRRPPDVVAEWQMEWKHTYFTPAKKVAKIESLSLVLTGTAFQQSVWQVMLKIPKGKALSYGDVARRIGNPRAARAVGMACGANPVAYLVPCHRVVAANGIGGFGSGLEIKKKLLKTEGYL